MRVIEPHHIRAKHKRRMPHRTAFKFVAAGVLLVVVLAALNLAADNHIFSRNRQQSAVGPVIDTPAQASIKKLEQVSQFTPNGFRDVYRAALLGYPNTDSFTELPEITGNLAADARIRSIAESRGFTLTRIPVSALTKTDEPMLKGQTDDLLQPMAHRAWLEIKEAAKKDNVPLALLSAYRSPEWQRDLFLERLALRGVTKESIAAGNADTAVRDTLSVTAVPGYSRHHTGYAVDFWCDDGTGSFGYSSCFTWLEKNNYLNAKKYGWIPSYPEGAAEQGPEPEPWEYVWVGKTALYN